VERTGKFVARRCLNLAIDTSGMPRKALADAHGMGESQFSKVTGGTALYDIDNLDCLPDDVLENFLNRYGAERGFEVRMKDLREIDAEVMEQVHRLVATVRLRDVRTRSAKADLRPAVAAERKRA